MDKMIFEIRSFGPGAAAFKYQHMNVVKVIESELYVDSFKNGDGDCIKMVEKKPTDVNQRIKTGSCRVRYHGPKNDVE